MPNRQEVYVNGKLFLFLELNPERAANYLKASARLQPSPDRCGLSGEVLCPDDGLYLVISNQSGVPNRIVGKKLADGMGLLKTANRLLDGWTEAMKYEHWFR